MRDDSADPKERQKLRSLVLHALYEKTDGNPTIPINRWEISDDLCLAREELDGFLRYLERSGLLGFMEGEIIIRHGGILKVEAETKADLSDRRARRFRVLHMLYDITRGNPYNSVNRWKIGEDLGFSPEEFNAIDLYLKEEHLVETTASSGYLRITNVGIDKVEDALESHIFELVLDSLPPVELRNRNALTSMASPFPPGLRWNQVTIQIASKDSIKITTKGHTKTFLFSTIGFTDGRKNDLPDTRWTVLQDLLRNGGEITDGELTESVNLKAAIKDIRKRLRFATGIEDDPIKYNSTIPAYKAEFIALDNPQSPAKHHR